MINYCQTVISELDDRIKEITYEQSNSLIAYENAIELVLQKIEAVKMHFLKIGFKDEIEEIMFFKQVKPQLISKLIFFNAIYKIETKRPRGGEKIIKKYLNVELSKIKRYFDANLEFYKYYRTNSNHLDNKYFVRGKHDIKLSLDTYYFEADHNFSTSHDFKVATILANDLIELYLENQLLMLENNENSEKSQRKPNVKMTWTGSKVALVELMYALHTEGVFNNGAADLKEIAEYFEHVFEIDLGQYRRAFLEIRARKSDNTKFLTTLNEGLLKRMENSDDII